MLDSVSTRLDGPRARNEPRRGPALQEFEDFLAKAITIQGEPLSLKDWRDLAEAWRIARALETCHGNRSAAARELGIGRRTLYAKMEKLGFAGPGRFSITMEQ